jgi:peptidyl-dipeptidase A
MGIRKLTLAGLLLLTAGVALFLLLDRRHPSAPLDAPQGVAAVHPPPAPQEIDDWLADYNADYRQLWTVAMTAHWQANVDINESTSLAAVAAAQSLADYAGSRRVIDQLERLRQAPGLDDAQYRQLEMAWLQAARHPATAPATVRKLLQGEARQSALLHTHRFQLAAGDQPVRDVTLADLERLLRESRNLASRQQAWQSSLTVGVPLKDGLVELQSLRNTIARRMEYRSFFDLSAADYGLSGRELLDLLDDLREGMQPLYEQLHCWARHELAARYGQATAPRLIPAHWLPERWGRSWPQLVPGVDLDGMFRAVSPQWIVEQGERFFVSLGLANLPPTFWSRSDLYPLPPDANRRKSGEAATWHLDLDQDVRTLLSVQNDFTSYRQVHRELGRVYYCLGYARPEVPAILRRGANRAFHGAIGVLAELAATQLPYLQQIDLLPPAGLPDRVRWLLSQALQGPVVFIPFACGTVAHWEHDLYAAELPRHLFNERWWQHAAAFQGIAPPTARGEEHCDPAALAAVHEQPAQLFDLAISHVIAHQLHRYICEQILQEDVHAANYHGNPQVGIYLDSILAAGATRDWNQLLREATGRELSTTALHDYYEPLLNWLREQNTGRQTRWQ